jgi:uncharacterized protein YcfJ
MKKVLKTVAIAIVLAFIAGAIGQSVNAGEAQTVKAQVEHRYINISVNEPYTKQDCVMVNVPIYGQVTTQSNSANTLIGGIIGGVIGNQIGGGSGKDVMTGLGAIFGATQASKPRTTTVITGHRQERQCTEVTHYQSVTKTVYDYSIITWTQGDVQYQQTFTK